MRNMRSTSSRGTYSRVPRNLYPLSTTYKQQIATNELNWSCNPVLLIIWKMPLDIQRRNSIAQQGKTPLQKNPDEVHLAIKARGEKLKKCRAATPSMGDRDRERQKKDTHGWRGTAP
jgi:hypothetical protein